MSDENIAPTNLIYFSNTYLFEWEDARVLAIGEAPEKQSSYVVVDKTIFYPQGGGQPADGGVITTPDGSFKFLVTDVRIKGEVVHHYGQISAGAGIPVGTSVQLKVDAQKRRVHARLHSAGHLVDVAVRSILPDLKPGRGCHFPGGSYVEYEGTVPEQTKPSLKASLETELGKLVSKRIKTSVCDASVDDVPSLCGGWMPDYLTDKSKLYRIVTVGGLGCPCGGTHVDSTDELAGLTVTGVKFPKGKMKVSYDIK